MGHDEFDDVDGYQKIDRYNLKLVQEIASKYKTILTDIGENPEREGLLKPGRSDGNTRLYSEKDLERLELILNLSRDMGVNLAGVDIILNLREKIQEMQQQINELVNYLKVELEKNTQQPQSGGPGLVKRPSANLVRLTQMKDKLISGLKR